MAAHAHSAHPDPLRRALAAAWHALRVTAAAVARFTVSVVRWCRGVDREQQPRLSRTERKRLRKEKLREALSHRKTG